MATFLNRRSSAAALLLSALAAVIIGCGGGGGGGGGTGDSGGNNGGNSGSNGGNTTPTNAGTIGGNSTAGNTGTGQLRGNAIYFVQTASSGYTVRYAEEPASGGGPVTPTDAGFSSSTEQLVTPDPQAAGQAYYVSATGGNYGIYRGTTPSTTTGAKTIVAPSFGFIYSLQVARDGSKVVFVAETTGDATPNLYVVNVTTGTTVATPTLLDTEDVFYADLNPAGTQVAYSRNTADGIQIYVRNLSASRSDLLTPTGVTGFKEEPQYSKDGSKIAFALRQSSGRYLIAYSSGAGLPVTTIPDPFNDPTRSLRAPTFNAAGTRVAFLVEADDVSNSGIYTTDLNGQDARFVVEGSPTILRSLYWTNGTTGSNNGRAREPISLRVSVPRKP